MLLLDQRCVLALGPLPPRACEVPLHVPKGRVGFVLPPVLRSGAAQRARARHGSERRVRVSGVMGGRGWAAAG